MIQFLYFYRSLVLTDRLFHSFCFGLFVFLSTGLCDLLYVRLHPQARLRVHVQSDGHHARLHWPHTVLLQRVRFKTWHSTTQLWAWKHNFMPVKHTPMLTKYICSNYVLLTFLWDEHFCIQQIASQHGNIVAFVPSTASEVFGEHSRKHSGQFLYFYIWGI